MTTKKQAKKPETMPENKEVIVLKNDTLIWKHLLKAGTQIEATAEIKKLLKPFGYFITKNLKNV